MTPQRAAVLLRLIGWGFIIFSTVFVTVAFSGFDGVARFIANHFDWTGPTRVDSFSRDAQWFGAIWSGLGAGFGALYVFVVAPLLTAPHREVQTTAKRGGLIAAAIWFIVDSAGSVAAGVPSNAVLNFLFLLCIAVPLMLVKIEKA